MRPIYETDKDRDEEAQAAKVIEKAFGCEVVQNKRKYPADYTISRNGSTVAFAEIKARTFPRKRYPDYMISLKKVVDTKAIAAEGNLPMLLFVKWTDGLFYLSLNDTFPSRIALGGRKDRNDLDDIEPCAFYAVEQFREVNNAA